VVLVKNVSPQPGGTAAHVGVSIGIGNDGSPTVRPKFN